MKYNVLFLLILLSVSISAENISKGKAEKMALDFFQNNKPQLAVNNLQMVYDGETVVSRAAGASPAFYVFNNSNGKGFVIIAGDDIAEPILGYSYENNFSEENLPPNVKGWLEGLKEQINKGRSDGVVSKASSRGFSRTGEVEVQLKTAKWNQHAPYDMYTPMINGKHSPTGCVITAAAIIMHYHKWPEKGTGVIPAYTTYTQKIEMPAIELGHTYEWNNMLDNYNTSYTDNQAHQVAQLMVDLGTMIGADYKDDETVANDECVDYFLFRYMNYNKFSVFFRRSNFADDIWHEMLCKELQNGRPIFYSASKELGHAFVLDGYAKGYYYSVNWGWGGNSNGFFLLSALNGYNFSHHAILGLKPQNAEDFSGEVTIGNGIELLNQDVIEVNTPFYLFARSLRCLGEGEILCALTDSEGYIKEELDKSEYKNTVIAQSFSCIITVPVTVGDRIRLFYRPKGTTDWKLVRGGEYSV